MSKLFKVSDIFLIPNLITILRFFLIAPMRASAKQRNRSNRIDWASRKYWNFFKYFLILIAVVFLTALLIRIFI